MPQRIQLLESWLKTKLSPQNAQDIELTPVAGDASFRRYFRASHAAEQRSYIVMDAPPEKEDCTAFIQITQQWRAQGIRVPELCAQDLENGFLLLEDFGDVQFYGCVAQQDKTTQHRIYSLALDELQRIQTLPNNKTLPSYDEALLQRELDLFSDWFIDSALSIALTPEQLTTLKNAQALLIKSALEQTQCVVHRDYHSRNIMMQGDQVGIIDFQDAVFGPATYDLVSLLKDCYIKLDQDLVEQLMTEFAGTYSTLTNIAPELFKKQFDLMGIQRHMKAAGIFARLALRDGKYGYLRDIPRTFSYIVEACNSYEDLHAFGELLEEHIKEPMLAFVEAQSQENTAS